MNNPALRDVAFLVGDWSITLFNASFIPDPQKEINFPVAYEWIEGGAAIAVQQGDRKTDGQAASWIIGADDSASGSYIVLYSDSRGVSRVYQMSFEGNIWKMWRDNRKFSQRFQGEVSDDRKTINAKWENSANQGKTWRHDFNMTYHKI